MAEFHINPAKGIALMPKKKLFCSDGRSFWTRRIAITTATGVDFMVLIGEYDGDEQALTLAEESLAERRLDAYTAQARESDPLLSPPREPLLSPPRAREPYTAPTLTEYPLTTTDYALPETQGTVDLAAEANPPIFKIGDRVTPVRAGDGLLAGKVYTVDEVHFHSTTGEELTGVEGSDRRWSNAAFRLADPDPLAEANPPMELPF